MTNQQSSLRKFLKYFFFKSISLEIFRINTLLSIILRLLSSLVEIASIIIVYPLLFSLLITHLSSQLIHCFL